MNYASKRRIMKNKIINKKTPLNQSVEFTFCGARLSLLLVVSGSGRSCNLGDAAGRGARTSAREVPAIFGPGEGGVADLVVGAHRSGEDALSPECTVTEIGLRIGSAPEWENRPLLLERWAAWCVHLFAPFKAGWSVLSVAQFTHPVKGRQTAQNLLEYCQCLTLAKPYVLSQKNLRKNLWK